MVKNIRIKKYKKLQDLELNFTPNVNIISGANGTCKTSLLHIISNAYKSITSSCNWINDSFCISVINKLNSSVNPKIESLDKGDKIHNDPASGIVGTLFTVDYFDSASLEFRRHNSSRNNRYALKPKYSKQGNDSLPSCPVIYLGLSRLFPFGEYQNEDTIIHSSNRLPEQYQKEIREIYKELTGISIKDIRTEEVGDIKTRSDFQSAVSEIDSNTISSGEDNLFIIITALVSLHYYFDCVAHYREVESLLLIDEFDATLHPSAQLSLLKKLEDYSSKYKIQVIMTTHSLSTVEKALKDKLNVIYLIDNIDSVFPMKDLSKQKIEMHLYNVSQDEYIPHKIPVFMEDEEARAFLNALFDEHEILTKGLDDGKRFSNVRSLFYLVDANIGSGNLINIFKDSYLTRYTIGSICILDGDQKNILGDSSSAELREYIMTLPGDSSPEKLLMDYSCKLFDEDGNFWKRNEIVDLNYSRKWFEEKLKPEIERIENFVSEQSAGGKRGKERKKRKDLYNKYPKFFKIVQYAWIQDDVNRLEVSKFFGNLHAIFTNLADFYGLDRKMWSV